MLRDLSRPIRTVVRWQLLATVALALGAGAWLGMHGALSAVLGGGVSVGAGLAAAFVASFHRAQSAGVGLLSALGAEAVKVGLIVLLLWVVLATYRDVVVLVFIGTFMATTLIFAMAFFVRDA